MLNTLIDLATYLLLRQVGLQILAANFISTSAGMAFSYVANHRFTFRPLPGAPVRRRRRLLLFLLVTGTGLWLLQPVVIVAVTHWLESPLSGSEALVPLIAKVCAIAVGLIWNYTLYSRVVFRPSRDP
ncbi:MAG: sugar translocase [Amnibacterium sp.]|nr:sugar translocase [Amnibacterium sp.]